MLSILQIINKYICTNRDHELILLSDSGNYLNSNLNSPAILFQYQIDHLAVKRCPILQSVLVDALLEKFTVTIALRMVANLESMRRLLKNPANLTKFGISELVHLQQHPWTISRECSQRGY